ncbi:hypothetical protein M427DRAFT_30911 [Gonapodya prolifera JEL478]|uniref:Uncharacterized protein n=1 Tax=Gonapodya prolifera (strain JEL478) TaxID=1344416 RepID=A0A139AJ13_GONPJ|nr:hypothetical protein M427DRAFT_30911 [Gonapodya prolifera JEL478]|eukprot:KXS16792.1 hypothetical protein M427DRAFT_30911 [Gonapodya prolifera JEL478]
MHSLPPPPPARLRPYAHAPPVSGAQDQRRGDSYRADGERSEGPTSAPDRGQRDNAWPEGRNLSAPTANGSPSRYSPPTNNRTPTNDSQRPHSHERFPAQNGGRNQPRTEEPPRSRQDPSRHYVPSPDSGTLPPARRFEPQPDPPQYPAKTDFQIMGAARRERERLQTASPTPGDRGVRKQGAPRMDPPPSRERKPLPPQEQIFTKTKNNVGASGGPERGDVGRPLVRRKFSLADETNDRGEKLAYGETPMPKRSALDRLGSRLQPGRELAEHGDGLGDKKRHRVMSPPPTGREGTPGKDLTLVTLGKGMIYAIYGKVVTHATHVMHVMDALDVIDVLGVNQLKHGRRTEQNLVDSLLAWVPLPGKTGNGIEWIGKDGIVRPLFGEDGAKAPGDIMTVLILQNSVRIRIGGILKFVDVVMDYCLTP